MTLSRIVIDGRMVGERLSGVGRTVVSLAKGLAELSRLEYEPVFLCAPGMRRRFAGFDAIETRTPYLDAKEILTLPIVLFKNRATLFHSPSHSSLVSAPCPWMQTLHDLIELRSGGPREQIYYEALVKPFALKPVPGQLPAAPLWCKASAVEYRGNRFPSPGHSKAIQ